MTRMSHGTHLADRSFATDQHMDEFCFYSEARALYAVVRVRSIRDEAGLMRVVFELCAVANRGLAFKTCLPEGTTIEVSCRRGGGWNQVWTLFPLGTNDLDDAILRVGEVRPSSKGWTWRRAEPPGTD